MDCGSVCVVLGGDAAAGTAPQHRRHPNFEPIPAQADGVGDRLRGAGAGRVAAGGDPDQRRAGPALPRGPGQEPLRGAHLHHARPAVRAQPSVAIGCCYYSRSRYFSTEPIQQPGPVYVHGLVHRQPSCLLATSAFAASKVQGASLTGCGTCCSGNSVTECAVRGRAALGCACCGCSPLSTVVIG